MLIKALAIFVDMLFAKQSPDYGDRPDIFFFLEMNTLFLDSQYFIFSDLGILGTTINGRFAGFHHHLLL